MPQRYVHESAPTRANSYVVVPEVLIRCTNRTDGKMTAAECGTSRIWNVSHCRVQGFSRDGGSSWHFAAVPSLPDTPVKGGVARWAAKKALLFSNPDLTLDKPCPKNCTQHWYTCCCSTKLGKECVSQRKFLSIFASTTNGKSWPFKKLVWPCVSV